MDGKQEQIVTDLDSILEEVLRTAPVIDSGKDGVILRVESDIFDVAPFQDKKGGVALKVLKVFNPGKAEREYSFHSKAVSILNHRDDCAHVPGLIMYRSQHLSELDRIHLNRSGTFLSNDAEIIIMDFIEGTNLAEYIFDFVLEKSKIFELAGVAPTTFRSKFAEVAKLLGFEFANSDGVGDYFDMVANINNIKKLTRFLQKNGFKLKDGFIEKLKRSVDLLKAEGIFHNDLSDRNIIVGTDGEPYIIDFGNSVSDYEDISYDDYSTLRRLKEMASMNTSEARQQLENEKEDIKIWTKYSSNEALFRLNSLFVKTCLELDFKGVSKFLLSSFAEETELNKKLAILYKLVFDNKISREFIKDIINNLLRNNLNPSVISKMKNFLRFVTNS